jgi:hypothetical protein
MEPAADVRTKEVRVSDAMDRHQVAEQALWRNLAWIAAADAKAPTILAINYSMLAALVPRLEKMTLLVSVTAALATSLILGSIAFLSSVVFPRIHRPKGAAAPKGPLDSNGPSGTKPSSVFFSAASEQSEADFVRHLSSGPTDEIVEDLARQAYRNAQIAKSKFRALRIAMRLLFLAVGPWIVAIGLLHSITAS